MTNIYVFVGLLGGDIRTSFVRRSNLTISSAEPIDAETPAVHISSETKTGGPAIGAVAWRRPPPSGLTAVQMQAQENE